MTKTNILRIFILTGAIIVILTLLSGCSLLNSGLSGISSDISKDKQQTDPSVAATDSISEGTVTETTEPVPANFYFDETIPENIKDSISTEL